MKKNKGGWVGSSSGSSSLKLNWSHIIYSQSLSLAQGVLLQ